MKGLILVLGLLLLAQVQADELYRSIDQQGRVHYGDSPLPGSEDVEQLKAVPDPTLDESLPYETRQAKKNFPVTLYTFPDCGSSCQQARDLLNKRGIPYAEKSLVQQEEIDAFRKNSGDSKLPAATIGKTWLRGFESGQWNQELDIAGYPHSAPGYRPPQPPATPPAAQ